MIKQTTHSKANINCKNGIVISIGTTTPTWVGAITNVSWNRFWNEGVSYFGLHLPFAIVEWQWIGISFGTTTRPLEQQRGLRWQWKRQVRVGSGTDALVWHPTQISKGRLQLVDKIMVPGLWKDYRRTNFSAKQSSQQDALVRHPAQTSSRSDLLNHLPIGPTMERPIGRLQLVDKIMVPGLWKDCRRTNRSAKQSSQ